VLSSVRLEEFAERGFVVLPQVVPPDLLTAASHAIDAMVEREPPGPAVRGPHFYFPEAAKVPALLAPLTDSPAFAAAGYPPIPLPEPEQIRARAGDVLLAHYLLGHNIGGNTSGGVRRALYFRIKRSGHDPRWREFLQDPWLDYDPVRSVTGRPG
jgi:ectoine hydroxylase-related dioxygenase (phytanoyl-CoA dioxygenase family)